MADNIEIAWRKDAIDRKCIQSCSVRTSAKADGVAAKAPMVDWKPHLILDVIFDWSPLHRALTKPTPNSKVLFKNTVSDQLAAFVDYAEEVEKKGGGNGQLQVTCITTSNVWELVPLDDAAQSMSIFEMKLSCDGGSPSSGEEAEASATSKAKEGTYQYVKGPAGQRPARDAIARVLDNLAAQLRQQNVHVAHFMGDFIVFSTSFDEAMHKTAAVHKCLLNSGFTIDGANSSFEPRPLLSLGAYPSGDRANETNCRRLVLRNSIDTAGMQLKDDIHNSADAVQCVGTSFLNDAFDTMIADGHQWLLWGPKTADDGKGVIPMGREDLTAAFQGVFLKRVKECTNVAPKNLSEVDVFFRGTKQEKKGPQRWNRLELRLFWMDVMFAHVTQEDGAGAFS